MVSYICIVSYHHTRRLNINHSCVKATLYPHPHPPLSTVCSDRGGQELQSLLSTPRVSEKREIFFEDRTKCHADHVDQGLEQQTTAAVGVLKAVNFEQTFGGNK